MSRTRKKHAGIYLILFMLLAAVFLSSCIMLLYQLVIAPAQNQSAFDQYKELMYPSSSADTSYLSSSSSLAASSNPVGTSSTDTSDITISEPPAMGAVLSKFEKLLALNEYTAGWLKIPGTDLDHPVFYTPHNQNYYLKRNPDGSYNKYGSLFLSKDSTLSPQAQIMVMYGHNMESDDRMFGQLNHYKTLSFLRQHPTFTFDTIYREGKWKIIAVCRAYTGELNRFDYDTTCFADADSFDAYIYQARIRSMYQIPDDPTLDDSYLVMSTCDYLYWGDRLVVVARRLRDGESSDQIQTDAYRKNPVQLWPDKYYTLDYVKATRPSDDALQSAYNAFYNS